jgi:2',3'-cyclic-nucleotide 2'-phosphodiesterase/3'-nucleotidase
MENGNWHLSKVPGIDAMLIGHSHQIFPNASSTVGQFNLPGVDKVKGTVNGVPTVMANFWGKHLGVIKLQLVHNGTKWTVDSSATTVEARSTQNADKSYVAADPAVASTVASEHAATIQYVKTPIGSTDFNMSSYFADVGDPGAIEVVNQAQAAYVAPTWRPTCRSTRPCRCCRSARLQERLCRRQRLHRRGQRQHGHQQRRRPVPVPQHRLRGEGAGQRHQELAGDRRQRFNRSTRPDTEQALVSSFPGYNFDMFTSPDIRYEIDVTQPRAAASRT